MRRSLAAQHELAWPPCLLASGSSKESLP
jgi:hypothetical protein